MSRVGRKPIGIPAGVTVSIEKGNLVTIKGPKGELRGQFHQGMMLRVEDGRLLVERPTDSRLHRALHGLTRSLLANMVLGVTEGFVKRLEIHGVGYRAFDRGGKLELQVGFSHPVTYEPPEGIKIVVEKQNLISVEGVDKQLVGQVAAEIRAIKPPEPYKQKGIRYAGEYVRKKAGKASA